VLQHYGYIEEYRPYQKPQYDLMHDLAFLSMRSSAPARARENGKPRNR
jgi:hypothetical protein